MIPDINEIIGDIERNLPDFEWLVRSNAHETVVGRGKYFANITPKAWRSETGIVNESRSRRWPNYAAYGDSYTGALYAAYNAAMTARTLQLNI